MSYADPYCLDATTSVCVTGKSAYDIAVETGFVGTEAEWLASLVGAPGADGNDGLPGTSAYQIAIAHGYTGTEEEWLEFTANRVQYAADIASLAGASTTVPVAVVLEEDKEGQFIWDPSDLRVAVAADTRKGIYVPPTNQDGSTGAWVRQFTGPVEVEWFSPDGADDAPAIHAAKSMASITGKKHVRWSKDLYAASPVTFDKDDLVFDGHGATIYNSANVGNAFLFSGNRMTFNKVSLSLTAAVGGASNFRCTGDRVVFHEPTFNRAAPSGVAFYAYGTNMSILGGSATWYSNYFLNTFSGLKIIRHTINNTGGDDTIVMKAPTGGSDGAIIAFNTINGGAAIVSFGSEIGIVGVNEVIPSRFIRNVCIMGNVGNNCSSIAYFKPGAVPAYDYRCGLIEDIVISDNIINDPNGLNFSRAVAVTAARGAIIRGVSGKNNRVRARCVNSGIAIAACLHVKTLDFRAISGPGEIAAPDSNPATITGIDVQVSYNDPYNGAASGGAAPGSPAANIALIERDNAWGNVSDITLDVAANGCRSNGIVVGTNLDDAVMIRRAKLTNMCTDGSGGIGAIAFASRIMLSSEISISIAAGSSAKQYKKNVGGDIIANTEIIYLEKSVAAGTGSAARMIKWIAPRNAFVHKVEILNGTSCPQSTDDTNFTQHEIRNENGTGVNVNVNTKKTGGRTLLSNTFETIYDAANLAGVALNDCFYSRNNRMSYTKVDGGAGRALTDSLLRIHWAPY